MIEIVAVQHVVVWRKVLCDGGRIVLDSGVFCWEWCKMWSCIMALSMQEDKMRGVYGQWLRADDLQSIVPKLLNIK